MAVSKIKTNEYVRKRADSGVMDAYVNVNLASNQYLQLGVVTADTHHVLIASNSGLILYDSKTSTIVHTIPWTT